MAFSQKYLFVERASNKTLNHKSVSITFSYNVNAPIEKKRINILLYKVCNVACLENT